MEPICSKWTDHIHSNAQHDTQDSNNRNEVKRCKALPTPKVFTKKENFRQTSLFFLSTLSTTLMKMTFKIQLQLHIIETL